MNNPQKRDLLILTKYDRLGSSSRLRFYQYLPFLEQAGFIPRVNPLLNNDYVRRLYRGERQNWPDIAKNYLQRIYHCISLQAEEVVWIEAELFPWLPFLLEKLCLRRFKKIIVDYDDAVFHKYDQCKSWIGRKLCESKIDQIMRSASLVVAGNRYIAQRTELAGTSRVKILPTVVDLERYPIHPPKTAEQFTLGWIGSPSTAKYLLGIQESIRTLCSNFNCRLVTIGSGPLNLPGIPIETRDWKEENEAALMRDFDVGIMPLPREAWTEGKCGYKLIQYMACGIPVVASPVGINREIVHANIGFLAESTEEWITGIRALQKDVELRASLGQAGRRRVEKEFSLQRTAPMLVQWINDLFT
jgi:glycosyltransferase involved in cell wall biosynthesis